MVKQIKKLTVLLFVAATMLTFASCEKDVLFRETIRLFGLNTLTAKARQYLEYAFAALQESGRI